MKRTILKNGLVYAMLAAASVALTAQQTNPYQGTANPPSDDAITTPAQETAPSTKPSPYHYAAPPSNVAPKPQAAPPPYAAETVPNESDPAPQNAEPAPAPANNETAPAAPSSAETVPAPANDDGIVQVAPPDGEPGLHARPDMGDPDGDIVHPAPLPQGELGEGTTIRVRLLDRLSTSDSQPGETFHTQVASDVVQNGQVIIPVGSQIDGRVISVSPGRAGGHGSMRLRPESVTLPDGTHFRLYAQLAGAPGSSDRIGFEGLVTPGSRVKKEGIEYGGAVGTGAVAGALLGGPGGALAGTIIGASVISVHLLVSHPQATLDSGTVLLFTLSQPLNLVPASAPAGN